MMRVPKKAALVLISDHVSYQGSYDPNLGVFKDEMEYADARRSYSCARTNTALYRKEKSYLVLKRKRMQKTISYIL